MKSPEQPISQEGGAERPKITRWLLLAALGAGLISDSINPEPDEKEKNQAISTKIEKPFELGDLASRFNVKKEVAGDREIMFIGQLHSVGVLAQDELAGFAPYVKQSQKDIERLILLAKERYGIDTVFFEGTDTNIQEDSYSSLLDKWQEKFDAAIKKSDTKTVYDLINNLVNVYNTNVEKQPNKQTTLGVMGYFLRIRVKTFVAYVENLKTAGPVPKFLTDRVAELLEDIQDFPLVDNDSLYVTAGAVGKLWAEGKIKIGFCDDGPARIAGVALLKTRPPKNAPAAAQADFDKKWYESQQIREDTVVESAAAWMDQRHADRALLVFGTGHDFSGNVRKYNKSAKPGATCGLTKFASVAAEDLMRSDNPNIRDDDNLIDKDQGK